MITLADAEEALIHHAQECEQCLRLAAFFDGVQSLAKPTDSHFRSSASTHSEEAFELSRTIVRLRSAR